MLSLICRSLPLNDKRSLQEPKMLILMIPLMLNVSSTRVSAEEKSAPVRVLIQTEKGDIEVELNATEAPITVANFLKYVDGKFYDGGRFHRTVKSDNQPDDKVKIGVVQGGINPAKAKGQFPPIKLERTSKTGLAHKDGTLSMARDGADTATSDF